MEGHSIGGCGLATAGVQRVANGRQLHAYTGLGAKVHSNCVISPLYDELMLGLEPGLNVLTGETGAGKSILVDALGLLAGGRADVGFIRNGQESALVQGMFAAGDVFAAARRLVAGSRNTARLNGELVSVAELSQAGGRLLAVFGQYASQALLDQAWQRDQLDRLLPQAATRSLEAYRATYARLRTVEREFETLEGAARDRERQLDMLRFQQDEIDAANLAFGEEEALQEELVALRNAERIALALAEASATLEVSETNAADLLGTAQKALNAAARFHPFPATLAEELRGPSSSIRAVAQEVAHFLETFEADPGRLDQAETRLATLERLKRKYGADIAAVLSYRDQVAAQLTQLENVEHDLATLAQERDTLVGDLAHQGGLRSPRRGRGQALPSPRRFSPCSNAWAWPRPAFRWRSKPPKPRPPTAWSGYTSGSAPIWVRLGVPCRHAPAEVNSPASCWPSIW